MKRSVASGGRCSRGVKSNNDVRVGDEGNRAPVKAAGRRERKLARFRISVAAGKTGRAIDRDV